MSTNSITGLRPGAELNRHFRLCRPTHYHYVTRYTYPRRDLNPHAKGTGFWVQRVYHSATRVILDRNGLEPLTLCLSNIHSNQLSYRSARGGTWTHINTVTMYYSTGWNTLVIMSPAGLEPATYSLQNYCSTIKLRGLGAKGFEPLHVGIKNQCLTIWLHPLLGARGFEPPRKIP